MGALIFGCCEQLDGFAIRAQRAWFRQQLFKDKLGSLYTVTIADIPQADFPRFCGLISFVMMRRRRSAYENPDQF
jgi:hypothetical protein